jgi:hypothetical protein
LTLVLPGLVSTEFAQNAVGGTPAWQPPTSAMRPQSAEEAADAIARAIENPAGEAYTNPVQQGMAVQYVQDVDAFERRASGR